jgi:hypothetical protein
MPSSLENLVDLLLPISGCMDARRVQAKVRLALKAELRAMVARSDPLPTSLDELADRLAAKLRAVPTLSALEQAQVELALAPHRRLALAQGWPSASRWLVADVPGAPSRLVG